MTYQCLRRDCEYYSTMTETCDYTLINSRKRPCPIDGCTEYRQREFKRTWMRFWAFAKENDKKKEDEKVYIPERPAAPREPYSVVAACGHEVYEGEYIYEWDDGETVCPDCFEDRFADLSAREKAALCGFEASLVRRPGEGAGNA